MEGNKTAIIITAVVALVLVAGGAYWLMNRDSGDEAATNTQTTSETTAPPAAEEQETADIVALASETESLSTLVTAVEAAGLVETLQGDGPFTVFAPTNDAFAALPAGTLDTLLLPENKDQLAGILTYHVVAGKVMSSDLSDGQVVTTVQGGTLTVDITDDGVYLVDAKQNRVMVTTADVEASNGVVHIINGVLLPQ